MVPHPEMLVFPGLGPGLKARLRWEALFFVITRRCSDERIVLPPSGEVNNNRIAFYAMLLALVLRRSSS
jgi:hypothetical protein